MVVGLSLYPVTTTTRSESSETAEAQALFSPLLCVPKVSNLFGTLASKFIASMTWIQSSGQILSWKIWAISWKLNSLTRKALNRPSSSELYEWQKSVLTCINFMSEEIEKPSIPALLLSKSNNWICFPTSSTGFVHRMRIPTTVQRINPFKSMKPLGTPRDLLYF